MPARYELHGIHLSGPTYKVGLMLALAGEPFDYVHVDLRSGAHKAPDYVARSRFGQVPCLVDTTMGRNLCQSAAILDYLADQTGKFGGRTPEERIQAREWMFWEFDRLAANIYRPRAAALGFRQIEPVVLAQYMTEGKTALAMLEQHLAKHDWLVGKAATIADIDVYGVVAYAEQGGYVMAEFPKVAAWIGRMRALPGFKDVGQLLPAESKAAA